MDIEEVAARTPEKIIKVPIDPALGLHADSTAASLAFGLGLKGKEVARRSSSSRPCTRR